MKKTFLILLAAVMLIHLPAALAELDFSGMTAEELTGLIAGATAELGGRHLQEERFSIPCGEPYTVYATGNLSWRESPFGYSSLLMEVVFENNTDDSPYVIIDYETVNGWDANSASACKCAPHSRAIFSIEFCVQDGMPVHALEEVTVLTLKMETAPNGVTLAVRDGRIIACTENTY